MQQYLNLNYYYQLFYQIQYSTIELYEAQYDLLLLPSQHGTDR